MQPLLRIPKQATTFSLSFFLLLTLIVGCNQKEREKEKVIEYTRMFDDGNYRKVVSDYQSLLGELNDTTDIFWVTKWFLGSQIIVRRTDSLLSIATDYSNRGYNVVALKFANEAKLIYPNDSLTEATFLGIPKDKTPKFKISGTYGSARFEYVFHSIWEKEELKPVSVDITVTNLDPISVTALAFYVPSFYYVDVTSSGSRSNSQ